MIKKVKLRKKRARKVRAKIQGTASCPRLCVFRSARFMYAQLIDDDKGNTLVSFDSRKLKSKEFTVEVARKVGKQIADFAKAKKIEKAVFDRSGYKYHGKVKAVADGAREGGLNF